MRDGYSNFGFFQALPPVVLGTASVPGTAIDLQGFETCLFLVNVGSATSAGAMSADNRYQLMLEHFNSAASAWSEVYPSQMIHSVVGQNGAYSALNSGIFQSIASYTDGQKTYAVGYKGPQRTVRLRISQVGAPSLFSVSAEALLGLPASWPVNSPV
jgi:hypothetical protein